MATGTGAATNDSDTIAVTVTAGNLPPTLDLDDTDGSNDSAAAYSEDASASLLAPNAAVGDGDDTHLEGATVKISTGFLAGDFLTLGGLASGTTGTGGAIAFSYDGTTGILALTGSATLADYQAALRQVGFSSTSNAPGTARTITWTVSDGDNSSPARSTTLTITPTNDSPNGTSATISASEDTFRTLTAASFGFTDPDSGDTMSAVTITAFSGSGQLYYDADGTAGSGVPVAVSSLPQTYTVAELAAGKVLYKAADNANGTALATIHFQVVDSAGQPNSTDPVANVLTVNVTAVNDAPDVTAAGTVNATEQTAAAILAGVTVSDADLDAKNGGNGDYAGASLIVNGDVATSASDLFTIVAGANFTVDGNSLKAGGFTFATFSTADNKLQISFTSAQTIATSALVDEVLQSIRYTNTSDTPPASRPIIYTFLDGAPGEGQGSGPTNYDSEMATVNIAAVNDAPVNSLGGTIGTGEDAVDAWLSGMSISDPDASLATDEIFVTFHVANGRLEILTNVSGGITAGDIVAGANDSGTITVRATLNQINATLSATNGLTYSPNAHYNGSDTLTVTTNDRGFTGADPGVGGTGDGTSEQDVDTRTITISAQPDAPVAQPDAVSTPENVIGTGNLFANNGSGADADADGDTITIAEVNGTALTGGTITLDLASGAKLTVNSDGSYSYDPNGKFNRLTDNSSGATNTSATETFTYKVTGGNTVTVTVTINGVAGPGDWLMGDSGNNTITGTSGSDIFILSQSGNDTVSGKQSSDLFVFGGTMTAQDAVDGGEGRDQISIQGHYTGINALILGAGVVNVESFAIIPGNNTSFGDPGTNSYSYHVTTVNENVALGQVMTFDGAQLRIGENFTFRGAAETNGSFRVIGGLGIDDFVGGSQSDVFLFNDGAFGSSDIVDGGAGPARDQLALRGNYSLNFGFGQITSIESLVLLSGHDIPLNTAYSYMITMNDDNLVGGSMTIDAAQLRSDESLVFFGHMESDGIFRISGGAGGDQILGGKLGDRIRGNGGGDNIYGREGADELWGGADGDRFAYDFTTDSTAVSTDRIMDFTTGDLIALETIDANSNTGASEPFTFIGSAAFTLGTAGQVRAYEVTGDPGHWFVEADVNGDAVADMVIEVYTTDLQPLDASDFAL